MVTNDEARMTNAAGAGTPVFVLQNGFISPRAFDRSPVIFTVSLRTVLQKGLPFCSIAPILQPVRWFGRKVSRQGAPARRPAARLATKRREEAQKERSPSCVVSCLFAATSLTLPAPQPVYVYTYTIKEWGDRNQVLFLAAPSIGIWGRKSRAGLVLKAYWSV